MLLAGTGTGLAATYYDNLDGSGPVIRRIDPEVNFDWGAGSPDNRIGADTFVSHWDGEIEAVEAGTYYFQTLSNEGVQLYVDGVRVIDNWTGHAATLDTSTPVTLAAGQQMWANRFGNLTAVRYPAGTPVQTELRQALDPARLGLFFTPMIFINGVELKGPVAG